MSMTHWPYLGVLCVLCVRAAPLGRAETRYEPWYQDAAPVAIPRRLLLAAGSALFLLGSTLAAQGRGGQVAAPQAPRTPRAAAPVDLTGYWVSVITEDWRLRMVTPPKGDVSGGLPLNADGRRVADEFDPAKDIAAGEQCRAFGAAGIMRMPVRLNVTWQDDTTLKVEVDSGNQARLIRFDKSTLPPAQPEWQGFSVADWETEAQGQGLAPAPAAVGAAVAAGAPLSGSLKVTTTRMRPGYLQRNGIPYKGDAVMTEYVDRTNEANGDSWLVLTSIVEDPRYLTVPFTRTTHYKREADGSKFSPRPCEVTPPVVGRGVQ